jgi:hyperosmotically inducible protein
MKRKLLAILVTTMFAAPAAYAQGTTAPKDTGITKDRPAASGTARSDTSAKAAASKDGSPDAVITGKIKSGFIKDKIVRSRNYNVDTNGGVVTVRGKARSQAEADRALEIAKSTEGVKSVNSEIKVVAEADKPKREGTAASSTRRDSSTASASKREPSDPSAKADARKPGDISTSAKADGTASTGTSASTSREGGSPDALITTKIKAEYAKDKAVSATNIKVDTNNGVVTLSGAAKSKAEADKAVQLARNIKDVKSVKNDIKVESK